MSKQIEARNVMSGTHGECWIDEEYMSTITAVKIELEAKYEDVPMPKQLITPKKLMSAEGKGEFKFNTIDSSMAKRILNNTLAGKETSVKIISLIDDPDAHEAERVVVYDAKLEGIALSDWENGKLAEKSVSFTWSKGEIL